MLNHHQEQSAPLKEADPTADNEPTAPGRSLRQLNLLLLGSLLVAFVVLSENQRRIIGKRPVNPDHDSFQVTVGEFEEKGMIVYSILVLYLHMLLGL